MQLQHAEKEQENVLNLQKGFQCRSLYSGPNRRSPLDAITHAAKLKTATKIKGCKDYVSMLQSKS